MRVLDADHQGADWRDVCRIVLRIDPDRARLAFESHLSRARWMTEARLSPFVAMRLVIIPKPDSNTRDLDTGLRVVPALVPSTIH